MTSHIFPRLGCSHLPSIAKGDGIYLIDTDGKRYLDGSSGAAVSCLGHSNTAVIDAIKKQVETIAYAHTSFFTSEPAEELARQLIKKAPDLINRAYFISGGSEAIEAALKLACQYHVANGEPQRRYIIGRQYSYHGNTLGALSCGYNLIRRTMFEPLLMENVFHISPCHYWRWGENNESEHAYGERMAQELETKITTLGAENVSAFIVETIGGATLGAVPAVEGYFNRIRSICNRYGVLLILDEVMCGVGRSGNFFACEKEGISGDIICIAKGLGAGLQPIGAMLCSEKIYEAVTAQHGGFQHGHTYMGHITACAAGLAVLQEIEHHHLLSNIVVRGAQLQAMLKQRLAHHPHIGDIRGRGLFTGIEFVEKGKQPFASEMGVHKKIKQAALAEGLIVYAIGGTADGTNGDHILLAPPFIINEEQIEELVNKLYNSFCVVFNS